MDILDFHKKITDRFLALPGIEQMLDESVEVFADTEPEVTLMPEDDVPSEVNRPEYRVTAVFRNVKGEAYTEKPSSFNGTLKKVLDLPVCDTGIDARCIAAINAVMNCLGLCPGTFPDDPAFHYEYADALCRYIAEKYGKSNLVLVGYDGYIVKRFVDAGMDFWTMDRNPDNITKDRFNHVIVNSGKYNREACFAWGRVFLVTGSTLCNGTITQYLDDSREVLLYGITGAGAATLLDIPWFKN